MLVAGFHWSIPMKPNPTNMYVSDLIVEVDNEHGNYKTTSSSHRPGCLGRAALHTRLV